MQKRNFKQWIAMLLASLMLLTTMIPGQVSIIAKAFGEKVILEESEIIRDVDTY